MFWIEKKPFLAIKTSISQTPRNRIFPTHAFGQKMQFFSLFVFPKNKTRNNV